MLQEFRYALRLMRLSPLFALVAIASLALGTGANTAIFQLLDAIRLRTLPVAAPQELAEVRIDNMTDARGSWLRDAALTYSLWETIRQRQQAFSGMFAWADDSFNLSPDGEVREVAGLWVSGDFFRVLGVKASLGRLFNAEDDQRGCGLGTGVVISDGFWRREFGGDPNVIGRKIPLLRQRLEIIGVAPREFFGLEVGKRFDVALPLCAAAALRPGEGRIDSGTIWWLTVMGRLKRGVSLQQASTLLQAASPGIFGATLPPGYPPVSVKPYLAMKLLAIPGGQGISHMREEYSTPLALLLAIAAGVLLIACANLANLMLARASARSKEMAVRLALGSSPMRLTRQLLIEGLLLTAMGAGLGLLVARTLSRLLVSMLAIGQDGVFLEISEDWRVWGFVAGLAVFACLVFASAPILRARHTDAAEALKAGGRSQTAGRDSRGLRRVLAVAQIAVSLALLTGTTLFVRSLRNLQYLDAGFNRHGALILTAGFGPVGIPPGRAVFYRQELVDHLRAIPWVEGVTELTVVPLTGADWNNRMWMDGSDISRARVSMRSMVGAQYFHVMGMALLAGRDFEDHDMNSVAKVAVVDEEFARQFNGGANPVGRRLWIEPTPTEPSTSYEIVGLVRNAKYRDLREPFQPVVFVPMTRESQESAGGRFLIRSNAPMGATSAGVRAMLPAIIPGVRYSLRVFDEWVDDSLLRERLMVALSGWYGALAIALTAVGLYGVISYTVARRTNEIGIRMALGAGRGAVTTMILRETASILGAGLALGTLLALAAARFSAGLLFDLEWWDPRALAFAASALAIVAAAASYLPASRAASLNPVAALRQE